MSLFNVKTVTSYLMWFIEIFSDQLVALEVYKQGPIMTARVELDSHWNLGGTPQKTATVFPGTDPELSLSPLKCLPGSLPKLLR